VLHLGKGALSSSPSPPGSLRYVGDKLVGMRKQQWMPSRPDDQTPDDSKSLVFDSAPLDADREILGNPLARIRVSANVPIAKIALRLTEVLPDGTSWPLSYGILNLTHRDSLEHPTPLEPAAFYDVEVPLYMVAHRFKWPSPEIATLTVDLSGSSLILPSRPIPSRESPCPIPVKHSPRTSAYLHTETGSGTAAVLNNPLQTSLITEVGTTVETQSSEKLTIKKDEPNSGSWTRKNITAWKRGDWDCRVSGAFELSSTPQKFRLR
jgi:predicted acyl esterase